ncbi:hypothetical protein [Sinorhizobium meliloti]|uniref:hypothetical protein n=1 Tax=Rhizobium meliloti TaxID=382 RepID=UPI003D649AA7
MKMETFVGVPPQHPAYRLGCKHVHAGCWQPPDDRGGLSNVVSLTLPEVDDITFGIALSRAQMLKARILVVADTHDQVERAALRIARTLPAYRRVSIERAGEAGWGLQ